MIDQSSPKSNSPLEMDTETLCTELDQAAGRLAFLAEASKTLAAQLDLDITFNQLVRLVVPYLADWCTVCLIEEGGSIRRVAVAHVDPQKEANLKQIENRFEPEKGGIRKAIQNGRPEMGTYTPGMYEELFSGYSERESFVEVVDQVGFHSYMIVPLIHENVKVGALGFVTTWESKREFTESDLKLAEELGRRAAAAVYNGRLYHRALAGFEKLSIERRIREEFYSTRLHDLKSPMTVIKLSAQLLLRQEGLSERTKNLVVRVIENIDRAEGLLEGFGDPKNSESAPSH